MKKTRIRIVEKTAITRDDAEGLVNEIAITENRRRVLNAECDDKILAIRESYGPAIENCAEALKTKSALVQAWAEANPEEFKSRKSVEFPAGKVGFRTGTPKLKTATGWTFARVLEKLQSLKWGAAFVRVKSEVDKEGIIAAYSADSFTPAELREIGCKVDQDESFFIEPDLTPFSNRITEEAA